MENMVPAAALQELQEQICIYSGRCATKAAEAAKFKDLAEQLRAVAEKFEKENAALKAQLAKKTPAKPPRNKRQAVQSGHSAAIEKGKN